jgi:hypothetical protein
MGSGLRKREGASVVGSATISVVKTTNTAGGGTRAPYLAFKPSAPYFALQPSASSAVPPSAPYFAFQPPAPRRPPGPPPAPPPSSSHSPPSCPYRPYDQYKLNSDWSPGDSYGQFVQTLPCFCDDIMAEELWVCKGNVPHRRVAEDGSTYTLREFRNFYPYATGTKKWREAAERTTV